MLITGVFAKAARKRPSKAGTLVGVRFEDELLAKIDEWVSRQGARLSRPEGIRRLTELALIDEQVNANRAHNIKGPLNDR